VDEPTAWLYQAAADREAAEHLVARSTGAGRCYAVAHWQQTVEKSIKAMVLALHEAGVLGSGIRPWHEVEPYVAWLLRLPRAAPNRAIQGVLRGLLSQGARAGIRALDALVPRWPPPRNTEYPFRDAGGDWTYPAAAGVFSQAESDQFRALAYRVLGAAGRVVSLIRRRPG